MRYMQCALFSIYVTRNSAVADKLRDAFVQYHAMAWLTPKTSPFPICVTTSNSIVLRRRIYTEREENLQH